MRNIELTDFSKANPLFYGIKVKIKKQRDKGRTYYNLHLYGRDGSPFYLFEVQSFSTSIAAKVGKRQLNHDIQTGKFPEWLNPVYPPKIVREYGAIYDVRRIRVRGAESIYHHGELSSDEKSKIIDGWCRKQGRLLRLADQEYHSGVVNYQEWKSKWKCLMGSPEEREASWREYRDSCIRAIEMDRLGE